jgi:hypothetical protein
MQQAILDAIKKHPGTLVSFVALTAGTWLVYDLYVKRPLSSVQLLGAGLLWGILVLAVTSVKSALTKQKPAPPPDKP